MLPLASFSPNSIAFTSFKRFGLRASSSLVSSDSPSRRKIRSASVVQWRLLRGCHAMENDTETTSCCLARCRRLRQASKRRQFYVKTIRGIRCPLKLFELSKSPGRAPARCLAFKGRAEHSFTVWRNIDDERQRVMVPRF